MKPFIFLTLSLAASLTATAENIITDELSDTLRCVDLDAVTTTASPKEINTLRRSAIAVSSYDTHDIEAFGMSTLKGLSTVAPSFYMPTYGSGMTGATYVRGIGSRAGTPAVGVYVDNQPYWDKGSYTFNFTDIERIDVLRGPQGTLYGRNTMGGLVRITTADPLHNKGTQLRLGYSGRNQGRRASAHHYLHLSDQLAASFGAFYEGANGFYRNHLTGAKADQHDAIGLKSRWEWQASHSLRWGLNFNYEYRNENANPYAIAEDTLTRLPLGSITQNRQSHYRRHLVNAALTATWKQPLFTLSSITAVQHIDDDTALDMDFIRNDYFSTTQQQKIQTWSEELVAKSRSDRRWEWTTGAFLAYQRNKIAVPVSFHQEGVHYLNHQMARAFGAASTNAPAMSLRFTSAELGFLGQAKTPTFNAAFFHQSKWNDCFFPGLSLTLGLRADYDYQQLDFASSSSQIGYHFNYRNMMQTQQSVSPVFQGKVSDDSWQLLPKVALQYDLPARKGNVYLLAANGFRSGGYNLQTFSSHSQSQLMREVMLGVKEFSIESIQQLPISDAQKQRLIANMVQNIDGRLPHETDLTAFRYQPEVTWSYEMGTHLNLFAGRLQMDAALFFMHTRNLQLTRFAANGLGRETVNAGKSRSLGAEVSLRGAFFDNRLFVVGSYGYARATFTEYDEYAPQVRTNVSRRGNRIPYTPQHTLALSVDYRQPLSNSFARSFVLGADLTGAGSIYWDTANLTKEQGYALLGVRCGVELTTGVDLAFYGRNLTNHVYDTFSFANLGRRLVQQSAPRHFGAEIKWRF